jgi:hypothetical protein
MPIPIYVFIDETFTDLYGSLKVAPVIFTFAFFTQECRNNVDFWRPLGFVPNLGYGKSKNDKTASRLKLQDFHDVLKAIFQSYIDVHGNGGIKTVITDFCGGWKDVTLKSWIHVVIGDTCGNNQLCGHYNTNGTNVTCPYRDCNCHGKEMSSTNPQCVFINRKDVMELEKDGNICDSKTGAMPTLSKYKIDNVFDHLPISHPEAGIYRLTPPEGLHVFGNGIYANFFQVIHDIFGTDSSGKTEKEEIETLHNVISADFGRQSERDFPRRSSRNGPLDGTKMGATERRGNLFAFVVTMLTFQGKTIVEEKLSSNSSGRKIEYSKFIETIILTLSFEKWLHDENLKSEVDDAGPWVAKLKELIKEHLDKESIEKKGNGWDTPKFHAMSKFLYYISLFGCATNFFGGPCESALKKIIKNPGNNTQRRAYSFCSQVAMRNFENFILELAWELVRESCGDPRLAKKCRDINDDTRNNDRTSEDERTAGEESSHDNDEEDPRPSAPINVTPEHHEDENMTDSSASDVSTEDDADPDDESNMDHELNPVNLSLHFEGAYTLILGPCQWIQRKPYREMTLNWDAKTKNVTNHPVSDDLLTVIKMKSTKRNTGGGEVVMRGYTMFKKTHKGEDVMYRSSEKYRDRKWYDFAYVKYNTGIFPAKILGFVKYVSGDIPEDITPHEMYAVIHTTLAPFDRDRLDNEFIRGFELGANEKAFDIVPVDSLESPMVAIENYGHSKKTRYITALNYSQWGKYFSRKMKTILDAESGDNNSGQHWKRWIHG